MALAIYNVHFLRNVLVNLGFFFFSFKIQYIQEGRILTFMHSLADTGSYWHRASPSDSWWGTKSSILDPYTPAQHTRGLHLVFNQNSNSLRGIQNYNTWLCRLTSELGKMWETLSWSLLVFPNTVRLSATQERKLIQFWRILLLFT